VTAPVVLITGALTGIGRATALGFAREGARIVVSGRHDDKGKALAAELQELGAEATFIKSDVRHEDEVRTLVDETVNQFGRLDVAVNNAGTEGKPGQLTDQTYLVRTGNQIPLPIDSRMCERIPQFDRGFSGTGGGKC